MADMLHGYTFTVGSEALAFNGKCLALKVVLNSIMISLMGCPTGCPSGTVDHTESS